MHDQQPQRTSKARGDGATGAAEAGRLRISRRQAMGRMSAVAGAGAVAWVVPEILTAKPAAGAALSGTSGTGGSVGVSTSANVGGDPGTGASVGASGSVETNGPDGTTTAADTSAAADPPAADPPAALAFTGLDIKRDTEVGAALVAGGWAMHHWASRVAKPAVAGTSDGHRTQSAGGR
jgi:hypothetical protein